MRKNISIITLVLTTSLVFAVAATPMAKAADLKELAEQLVNKKENKKGTGSSSYTRKPGRPAYGQRIAIGDPGCKQGTKKPTPQRAAPKGERPLSEHMADKGAAMRKKAPGSDRQGDACAGP